jgi:predicted NBD/HSP70 family sugar kinase
MVLAIDVGGTKTLLAVFTQDGDLKQSVKFPTPPDYNDFLLELAKNVDSLTTNKFMICDATF